jgi:hypothetical protein
MKPHRFVTLTAARSAAEKKDHKAQFLTTKDLLTIAFSLVALGLSVFSTYVQYIKFNPGLSVGWANYKLISAKKASGSLTGFSIGADMTASFINTGNVPLLIQSLSAAGRDDGTNCGKRQYGGGFTLGMLSIPQNPQSLSLPLVSKAGEIVIVPLHIDINLLDHTIEGGVYKDSSILDSKSYHFVYCLRAEIFDTRGDRNDVPLNNVEFHYIIDKGMLQPSAGTGYPSKVI